MEDSLILLGVISGFVLLVGIILIMTTQKPKPQLRSRVLTNHPIQSPSHVLTGYPSQYAELVGIKGQQQGKKVRIDARLAATKIFSIGRTTENMLVINNSLVSRVHAQIMFQDGVWILYDRDSANGTWVNEQQVAQHYLKPNDQIRIGSSVFTFIASGAKTPPPEPSIVLSPGQFTASNVNVDIQNYQRLEELGVGGMAKIYKAKSRDGQIRALKFLMRSDPYLQQKFQSEIRVGETLRHPNITRIYGGGMSPDGKLYFVMEYIDGDTLRQHIGRLDHSQIVSIIGQTCDALYYAHGLGIYHRDLKPENIMIRRNGQVKVIDFGIAKVDAQVTMTAAGMVVGTPYYLSFEQAKGYPVDGRSDIYSLGIVMYEMLTGRLPFFSEDPLEVVHYHVTKKPEPLRRFNSQIPPAIEQAVLRCLSKNKKHRFQDAAELARAIGYTPQILSSTDDSVAKKRIPSEIVVKTTGHVISVNNTVTGLRRQDINPNDPLISRSHAQIIKQDGRYWLKDTSFNGTFLNGIRVEQMALLQPGDQVRIGDTVLYFRAS